jgi:Tfp pilus assembly protein PilX
MKEMSVLKNEEGFMMVTTICVLILLTIIGLWAHSTSVLELQIAGSDRATKTVFYAAEAGIEAGRSALAELKRADKGNWDNLLQDVDLVGHAGITTLDGFIEDGDGNDRNVGLATFTLAVRDNNDLDGNDQIDSDNIIILTSTGNYKNGVAEIETHLSYVDDEYAQEHYNASSTGEVQ